MVLCNHSDFCEFHNTFHIVNRHILKYEARSLSLSLFLCSFFSLYFDFFNFRLLWNTPRAGSLSVAFILIHLTHANIEVCRKWVAFLSYCWHTSFKIIKNHDYSRTALFALINSILAYKLLKTPISYLSLDRKSAVSCRKLRQKKEKKWKYFF